MSRKLLLKNDHIPGIAALKTYKENGGYTAMEKALKTMSPEALLEEVWEYQNAADTRLVNVHVQRLRAKVEVDPEHPEIVVTVRGVGYKAGQT